jgi:hypothetical protein
LKNKITEWGFSPNIVLKGLMNEGIVTNGRGDGTRSIRFNNEVKRGIQINKFAMNEFLDEDL